MKGLIKTNINLAKRFSTTVRYIDDLLTLNNTRFQEEIPNILVLLRNLLHDIVMCLVNLSIV